MLYGLPSLVRVLAPVPLLLTGLRWGPGTAVRASLIGAALVLGQGIAVRQALQAGTAELPTPLVGPEAALLGYGLMVVLPAAVLAWRIPRSKDGVRALTGAVWVQLAAMGLVALAAAVLADGGLAGVFDRALTRLFEEVLPTVRQQGWEAGATWVGQVAEWQASEVQIRRWAWRLLPGMIAAASVVGLWVNLVYARWFTPEQESELDLVQWRMPEGALIGFMVCNALVVTQVEPLGSFFPPVAPLLVLGVNILMVLVALYWLQGVATARLGLHRLQPGPPGRLLSLLGLVLLLMIPVTSALFVLLGLGDAWFDLRRMAGDEPGGEER